ncbi:MAG TPA: hypothetical protein VHC63_16735 [Acidimicrobiales bacterium]|nr:hypothetical protein [Acidimicrobiales bacterium]
MASRAPRRTTPTVNISHIIDKPEDASAALVELPDDLRREPLDTHAFEVNDLPANSFPHFLVTRW